MRNNSHIWPFFPLAQSLIFAFWRKNKSVSCCQSWAGHQIKTAKLKHNVSNRLWGLGVSFLALRPWEGWLLTEEGAWLSLPASLKRPIVTESHWILVSSSVLSTFYFSSWCSSACRMCAQGLEESRCAPSQW